MSNKKTIELLSDAEHVRLRPQMYISSIEETEENIHYLDAGIIKSKMAIMSVGMYKILFEIIDNAFDAIKRTKSHNKLHRGVITVELNKRDNSVMVMDNGEGFYKGVEINPKSKVTNIETAYGFLKSSTNYQNDKDGTQESLIGTNGVGGSLTNILSEYFHVTSINSSSKFTHKWVDFKSPTKPVITKGRYTYTGTQVDFVPRIATFGTAKYDESIIAAQLAFRTKCLKLDPVYKDVDIAFRFIGEGGTHNVDIPAEFYHPEAFIIENTDFSMAISPKYTSEDFMMINSTQCTGSPTRILQDIFNDEIFGNAKANLYYHLDLMMNLPPALVKFKDQIKTQYDVAKPKVSPVIEQNIRKKLKAFIGTPTFKKIEEDIDRNENAKDKKLLSKDKKKVQGLLSRYTGASGTKDFLFMVEGDSAAGSMRQSRNPGIHGVLALRGKVANCSKLSDLRNDTEIMSIISVLDLEIDSAHSSYKHIVIATDADPDGYHIASLLYNFFYRWFPKVVEAGRLYIFQPPLVAFGTGKNTKYLYSLQELETYDGPRQNQRYLKGLGSLDKDTDWPLIYREMRLLSVRPTSTSLEHLNVIFGNDTNLRKQWLSEQIKF